MVPGLVSIIVPFFNRALFLGKTIQTILNQDYGKIELFLVDDGSTDNSAAVARAKSDSRIKHLQLGQRSGKSAALNYALPLTEGEWITFFDSDDLMTPDSVSQRVNFLKDNPRVLSVMGNIGHIISDQNRPIPESHPLWDYQKTAYEVTKQMANAFGCLTPELFACGSCPLAPLSSTLMRKQVIERVGKFREDFKTWEDREYLTRAALDQPISFLDKDVMWYRVHQNNLSFEIKDGQLISRNTKPAEDQLKDHCKDLILQNN